MIDSSTERLAELIDKRHRCLLSLHELSSKQSGMIASGDMPALLRSFSAKNQWIVALQAIESELNPFHQQDPGKRSWRSETERQKCAERAAQCTQLLKELMQLERDNEKEMTQRRDQVAAQLQTVQTTTAARHAYQSQQELRGHGPQSPTSNVIDDAPTSRLDLQSEAR